MVTHTVTRTAVSLTNCSKKCNFTRYHYRQLALHRQKDFAFVFEDVSEKWKGIEWIPALAAF